VGPESAGADPGPCCYGKGTQPTVTDANLLLTRISPDAFLGGRKKLAVDRSIRAINRLAKKSGCSPDEIALSIIRLVNSNMERAMRVISVERGFDPRDFTLISFGGAGGLHVCELANSLHIKRVFVPVHPGVISAWGAVSADIIKDASVTIMLMQHESSRQEVKSIFEDLEKKVNREMKREFKGDGKIKYFRSIDMRYAGQSFEIQVPYSGGLKSTYEAFDRLHKKRYGHASPELPKEIVTLRLQAVRAQNKLRMNKIPTDRTSEESTRMEGAFAHPVYDRSLLRSHHEFKGPALFVEDYATTYLPDGWNGRVDLYGNLHLTTMGR